MARGGARQGAGRKKRVDEDFAQRVCMDAVVEKYGSLEAAIKAEFTVLGSDKIRLFFWQHILGIPEVKQTVKHTDPDGKKLEGGLTAGILKVEVVRTVHNQNDHLPTEESNG